MPFPVGLYTVALRRYRGNGRVYVSQIPNAFYVESKRNLTFLSPKFVHTYHLPFAILPFKSSG